MLFVVRLRQTKGQMRFADTRRPVKQQRVVWRGLCVENGLGRDGSESVLRTGNERAQQRVLRRVLGKTMLGPFVGPDKFDCENAANHPKTVRSYPYPRVQNNQQTRLLIIAIWATYRETYRPIFRPFSSPASR